MVFSPVSLRDESRKELPLDYTPQRNDVICSRGAESYNHTGNQKFRMIVDTHLDKYSRASTKLEKSIIVSSIIDEVTCRGGLFIRQCPETTKYFVVGDKLSREKAGQAIRAQLRKMRPLELKLVKAATSKPQSTDSLFQGANVEQSEQRNAATMNEEHFERHALVTPLDRNCTVVSVDADDAVPPPLPMLYQSSSQWSNIDSDLVVPPPIPMRRRSSSQWTVLSDFDPSDVTSFGPSLFD